MIIRGNTVSTTMPRTNYEQTDSAKADYLKGKDVLDAKIQDARTAADNAQTAADKMLPKAGGTMEGPIHMNGQVLKGLNAPATDDEAANMGYVKRAYPHNLLDNSDFRNPVNQRGATTYAEESKYTIDRWYKRGNANAGSIMIESNGVRLDKKAATIYFALGQALDPDLHDLAGKTVTFAVNVKECTVPFSLRFCGGDNATSHTTCYKELVFHTDGIQVISLTMPAQLQHTYTSVVICPGINESGDQVLETEGSVCVEWAAVYEGEYTAETLPEYKPKGYGAELAECMRYYQNWKRYETTGYLTGGGCSYCMPIYLDVPMRICPSVIGTPIWGARIAAGGYSKYTSSGEKYFTEIEVYTADSKDVSWLYICDELTAAGGDTNNSLLAYRIGNLELSADL